MSFLELLQKSREVARLSSNSHKDLEHPNDWFEEIEEDIIKSPNDNTVKEDEIKPQSTKSDNTLKEEEIKTQSTKKVLSLGDLIILESKEALVSSKVLKHINAAKRLAIKLSSGNITHSELQKCFKMQERFKHKKNTNYKLVGGEPMSHLKQLLEKGLDLNVALNTQYQENHNE